MIALVVSVDVKTENIEDFKKITEYNHINARKEPGNIRFDVLQDETDKSKFVLYEVYADKTAVEYHKSTEHYKKWSEEVSAYMASPRTKKVTEPIYFN